MDEVLRLENVEMVKAGKKILRIDYMQVINGDRIAIIGPNGAGKSTLLKVLGLMEKPTRGNVYFNNKKVDYGSSVLNMRRQMSAVFQRPLLLNTTVYNNAALGLKFRGTNSQYIKQKVEHWLKTLSIWELRNQAARTLSGGEAQRLSIVRALCTDPQIIFFDEPFAALDAPTREKLMREYKDILDSTGITSVLVTHDFSEVPLLSTKVAVIFNGELAQFGLTQEVLNRPLTEEIAQFVGVENILDGSVESYLNNCINVNISGKVILAESNKDIKSCQKVKVCIRPEKVKINAGPLKNPDVNQFEGEIAEVINKGSHNKLRIDCGFEITAFTIESYSMGEKVSISFLPQSAHVIQV